MNLVSETNPDRLEIQSGNLLPIMVKALQEMKANKQLQKNTKDNDACYTSFFCWMFIWNW